MKEVVINGVEYLPASALTKQFRYTSDYIGQLCRAKKVDAQLIGRSWYVNPISLAEHKKNRHAKPVVNKVTSEESTIIPIKSITSVSILNNKPPKATILPTERNFAKRISWKPLRYETDEQELLPSLSKPSVTRKIPIDLAESTDIAINKATKSTIMVAEQLPSVVLSGDVKVFSAEDNFESEVADEEEIDLAKIPMPQIPVPLEPRVVSRPKYLDRTISQPNVKPSEGMKPKTSEKIVPVELKIPPAKIVSPEEPYDLLQKFLLLLIVLVLISLSLLFFTDLVVEWGVNSFRWYFVFSWPSLDLFSF